jgi:hypothetical protein
MCPWRIEREIQKERQHRDSKIPLNDAMYISSKQFCRIMYESSQTHSVSSIHCQR